MQPSHDDNLVSDRETIEGLRYQRIHFEPGIGRALRSLFGRFAALLDGGSDYANGPKLRACPKVLPSLLFRFAFLLRLHLRFDTHTHAPFVFDHSVWTV